MVIAEHGNRVPSATTAMTLVLGYDLDDDTARRLYRVARCWVGRDSPYRTGYYPDEGERGLPWGEWHAEVAPSGASRW